VVAFVAWCCVAVFSVSLCSSVCVCGVADAVVCCGSGFWWLVSVAVSLVVVYLFMRVVTMPEGVVFVCLSV